MKRIKNMSELSSVLLPLAREMVEEQTNYFYETLNYFIQKYYSSYTPESYRRLYDFMYSAFKVEPKITGNTISAIVYINYERMDNYKNATGLEVVTWANQGLHGGVKVGNGTPHVWDDTIDKTIANGKLLKQATQFLQSKGFTVHTR